MLVPTRELCQQVQEVADRFGYPMRMRSAAIYGGANRYPQLQKLSRGKHRIEKCMLYFPLDILKVVFT